jgi:RNA polymerase sigma-70 factor, ECF subfamily
VDQRIEEDVTFEGTRSAFGMDAAAAASSASLLRSAAVTVGSDTTDFESTQDDADAQLMARVAAGDGVAFDVLVTRHQRPIVGYLRGMLGDRDEALDGAQEVFIRVFTRADRYSPSGPFRAWLFKIATNVAIDSIRSRRRRWFGLGRRTRPAADAPHDAPDAVQDVADLGPTALRSLIEDERDALVQRAVSTLPGRYRAALVLRDLQDLSYEEAAVVLGCRVGTVKSRVNRARNLLREKLGSYHAGVS